MGKSRTVKTKRIADMMLEGHSNKFTTNFEENKRLVSELMIIPSKQLRNEIAGYLTSFMNTKQKQMTET